MPLQYPTVSTSYTNLSQAPPGSWVEIHATHYSAYIRNPCFVLSQEPGKNPLFRTAMLIDGNLQLLVYRKEPGNDNPYGSISISSRFKDRLTHHFVVLEADSVIPKRDAIIVLAAEWRAKFLRNHPDMVDQFFH